VLFGKYSSGGFSARLLFSVLFLGLAMLLLDKKKSVGEAISMLFIMTFSTVTFSAVRGFSKYSYQIDKAAPRAPPASPEAG
jgi:hypothetical protein